MKIKKWFNWLIGIITHPVIVILVVLFFLLGLLLFLFIKDERDRYREARETLFSEKIKHYDITSRLVIEYIDGRLDKIEENLEQCGK